MKMNNFLLLVTLSIKFRFNEFYTLLAFRFVGWQCITKINTMIKYKIKANKEQLLSFGIDYDITGLTGELKYKYPTGWYEIEVTHSYEAGTFTNTFDIPKTFLERVENES